MAARTATSTGVAARDSVPRARPAARPARAAARTRRPARTRGVAGGILWIGLVALLLAGVVALNVAVLQLNVRLDGLGRERTTLRAENAALASQLSSAAVPGRIETLAQTRLGLLPAALTDTRYVDLDRR